MAGMIKKSVKFVQASAYKVDRDACDVICVGSVEYCGSASERHARKACTKAGYDYDFVNIDSECVKTYEMDIETFLLYAHEVGTPDAVPSNEM